MKIRKRVLFSLLLDMRRSKLSTKLFKFAFTCLMFGVVIGGLANIGSGILSTNDVYANPSYDVTVAVNYAETWWNGRNSSYRDYGDLDCANFVSQSLMAGGLDLSAYPNTDDKGSIINCDYLHDYLVNNLGVQHESKARGELEPIWFLPGDVAIFGDNSDHWRHAVFCVTGDATSYATCNAHSQNVQHITIQQFFNANSSFTLCNYYHVSGEINLPPPPPELVSPGSDTYPGLTIDTLTPWFNWNSVPGADYYGLYIRDLDADILVFDSQRDYGPIYGNSFPLPAGVLSHRTHYRWNMNSNNTAGWGDYSNRLWFTTYAPDETFPVVEFFRVSPNSITPGNEFTITYIVSDIGSAGLKQTELWCANDVNGVPDWEGTVNPVQTTALSGYDSYTGGFYDGSSLSEGTYWYGLHVVDNAGNWNDEQNSHTGGLPGDFGPIRVEVVTNNSPQLSNGYVNPPSGTPSTSFYYYVTYFDSDGDSPTVKQVYIDGVAYNMDWYQGLNTHITYRFGPKNLSTVETHRYFFYFEDGRDGTVRLPSGTDIYLGPIVSQLNNPPNTPSSPSPLDDGTGVSVDADLNWTGSDPDVGDTVTYGVYFGTSDTPPLVSNDQSATTYDPGTLNHDTHYYWKIVSMDNHDAISDGPLWDFITGSVPNTPPIITIVTASQGSPIVDITYDVSDNEQSYVTISFDYWDGNNWESCTTTTGESMRRIGNNSGTWNAKADFDEHYMTDCRIRVTADDGQAENNSDSDESSDFTLDTKYPIDYGCDTPADDATNVSINPNLTCLTASDDSPPVSYYFQIAGNDTFNQGLQENGWQSNTAWSPTTLGYNTQYFWRLKARDSYGNETDYSTAFTFTTGTYATEVWVDDDWAGSNYGDPVGGHTFGIDAFATIQDGIDAVAGSSVHVATGTYYENLVVEKEEISLIGENKNTTIIDGNRIGSVVQLKANGVYITGFTIKNGPNEAHTSLLQIFENSSYNHIAGNNLISSRYGIMIYGPASNNLITGNYFSDIKVESGVIAFGGSNNTIKDNIMNFAGQDVGAWTGVTIMGGGADNINNRIVNNHIIGPSVGVFLSQCHGNLVSNNIIEDVGRGIFLGHSSHNIIAGNNLSQVGRGEGYNTWQGNEGIDVFHSSNNVIINNNISMKGILYGYGIIMTSSSNNTLQGNIIESAARGIGLFNSAEENEVKYNNIVSSKEYGAILHNTGNNTIHHNNFINNDRQAYDDGGNNFWNYASEGNYWSDFQGDGNYIIYPQGIDNYPLADQVTLEYPPVPPQEFVPEPPPSANWFHINYTDTWENVTINLSYLRIYDGGNLTLNNVNLLFDQYPAGISVEPGSSLRIYNSKIACAGYGCGFTFDVWEDTIFEMKNSELYGAGFRPMAGEWGGLVIFTENATIENNMIADCGCGISIDVKDDNGFIPIGATSIYVNNNTIMNCYEAIGLAGSGFDINHVADNTVLNCIWRFLLDEWNSELTVSSITHDSAVVEWKTVLTSDSIVEYGETDSYELIKVAPNLTNNHSVPLTGLSSSTTYHFRIKSTDFLNHTLFSSDYTFTTTSPLPPSPSDGGGGGGGGGGGSSDTTSLTEYTTDSGKFVVDATAASADGRVKINIPKDTTGKDRNGNRLRFISIKGKTAPSYPPADCEFVCLTYDIGPNSATLEPFVYLIFFYSDSQVPIGVDEENLVLATWQDGNWVALEGCVVDPDKNTITAPISHFTIFTAMARTAPARFEVAGMTVTPTEVNPDAPVTVNVTITNTGDMTGSYTVVLKTNNADAQDKVVTLKGGKSQTVSFTVTPDTAGTYNVNIAGLSGKFTVKESELEGEVAEVPAPVSPKTSPTPTPQPEKGPEVPVQTQVEEPAPSPAIVWWPIVIYVACGVIMVGLGTYFFIRRRSTVK